MKTIALVSGGKDSILSILAAYRYGHEPAVVVNMMPRLPAQQHTPAAGASPPSTAGDAAGHDIDSYMYQTVGFEAVEDIAACLGLPLRRGAVQRGAAVDQSLLYHENPSADDEVESLYRLLKAVKEEFPEVEAVTSGAILSNYQRNRVEYLCDRLGLTSLAYLWKRDGAEVLDMVTALRMEVVLVKTASIGLDPRRLIGETLQAARPTLEKMAALYETHLAGEGGEYESTVLNCPLFRDERLVLTHVDVVMEDDNSISPSGHGILTVSHQAKAEVEKEADKAVLRQLLDGRMIFVSDMMPLIASLSPWQAREDSTRSQGTREKAAPFSFRGVAARWKSYGVELITETCSCEAAAGVLRGAVATLMTETLQRLQRDGLAVFNVHLQLSSLELAPVVRAAYAAVVPHICPPGFTLTAAPASCRCSDTVAVVLMELLAFPVERMGDRVLHAQSRTCWMYGAPGPFAQGRCLQLSEEEAVVFITAAAGRVPATGALATTDDFPPLLLDLLTSGEQKRFAAQFAYAAANVAAALSFFSCSMSDVRHAVVICGSQELSSLAPSLWRWCCGGGGWGTLHLETSEGLPDGEVVRIAVECSRN